MPIVSVGQITITDTTDSLSATLSSESVVVPSKPDGTFPDLSGCSTTVSMLLGGVDDTTNWSITATPSVGVAGTLVGRTYTVSNLTVDAGWVDFTLTRSGWATASKRFNISKGKQGVTGPTAVVTPGRPASFTSTDGVLDAGQQPITFTAAVGGIESPTYAWGFFGLQSNPVASTGPTQVITPEQFGTSKSATVSCVVNGTYSGTVTVVRLERSTAQAGATVGAPAGTMVGSVPAEQVESQASAQARADAARTTAEAYALAQANLARTDAQAHADGAVTAAEQRAIADATAKANAAREAAISAAAADATAKANAITVGGRNTFISTDRSITSYFGAVYQHPHPDCPYGFGVTGSQDPGNVIRLSNVIHGNGEWTVSWDMRGSQSGNLHVSVDMCDGGNKSFYTTEDNQWKRFSHTVNVTNHSESVYNFVDFGAFDWAYFFIRNIKIERGNKATDWSPAPEDVAADAQSRADAARLTAEAYALSKANLAETQANAYADGKVSAEEGRAIADATAKAEAARQAALAAAELQMGKGKWLIKRYPVVTAPGTSPSYAHIAGVAPAQTLLTPNATSFDGIGIFGANHENYIGVASCFVEVSGDVSIPLTAIGHDDGGRIYVNGASVYARGDASGGNNATLPLKRGWNAVELLWAEQGGGDGFTLGYNILSNTSVVASYAILNPTGGEGQVAHARDAAIAAADAKLRATSLGLPLEQWSLGGQQIVDVADGKVGTKALRLVGRGDGSGYPNQGNFIQIDRSKTYRTSFWARPSADCAGLLYFTLQQFMSDGNSGPINGGRAPYKPSGYNKAVHDSQFGAGQWGFYSYTWTASDWQDGVTQVRPDFLDNYSGAAGHWDVQAFEFRDITEAQQAIAAAAADATAKANAAQAAAQAYAAAQASAADVSAKAYADGRVSAEESRAIADAQAKANAAGQAAIAAAAADATAKANVAATTATWGGVTGAGKPADNATSGSNLVRKSVFVDGTPGPWQDGARIDAGGPDTRYLEVSGRDTHEYGNDIRVTPGERFYVSFYGWTVQSSYTLSVGLRFQRLDGSVFSWIGGAAVPPGYGWTKVSGYLIVPGEAASAIPWIQIDGPGGTTLPYCALTQIYIGRVQEGATLGAPAGTLVGTTPAESVESLSGAQAKADAAANWAVSAAQTYAAAQASLAETQAKAHADGRVSAEEQRAIADAAAKAEAARAAAVAAAAADATAKANVAATTATWSGVSGTGRPQDNATVGATAGENLKDPGGNVITADAIANNLAHVGWWKRDAAIPWNQNYEYNRIIAVPNDVGVYGPRGGADLVWYCNETTGDGNPGGGWNDGTHAPLDINKTYRFAIPIRRISGSGNSYWGLANVCDLNTGNGNGNPYLAVGNLSPGRWYLFVGYVFPAGSTGNTNDGAGIWDCLTGEKIAGGTNYTFGGIGNVTFRAYQYYASAGAEQLFGRPMVNLVDGTEPSLREYFEPTATLNNRISITGGALQGIGAGAGTVVSNDQIGINSSGQIYGVGAGAGTAVSNNQIYIDGVGAVQGIGSGAGTQVDNSRQTIGQNLIPNSDQITQTMVMGWNPHNATWNHVLQFASNLWSDTYVLKGQTTNNLAIKEAPSSVGNLEVAVDIYPLGAWDAPVNGIPVVAGQRYCFSAYLQGHRCYGGVGLQWFNAAGAFMGESSTGALDMSEGYAETFAQYRRCFTMGVAPTGAAFAMVYIRKFHTFVGQGDSWFWLAAPQLEAVAANAEGPGPYMPGPPISVRQIGFVGDLDANKTTNTNQLTDGAGLGTTAVWGGVSGAGKPLDNAGQVLDTRSVNTPPNEYVKGNHREFKQCSVVGISTASTYCVVETIKGWQDSSGGEAVQWAYVTSGEVWKRSAGASATSWGAWVRDLDRALYTGDLEANKTSVDANGNIQGVASGAGQSVANNTDSVIRAPQGGVRVSQNSNEVGRIKIKLPQGWTDTMMRFTVEIFEYLAGYSCTLEIAGYNYSQGGWVNVTARVMGGSNVEYPVYFGCDPTSCCVWIGNAGETWSYPQVRVRDFFAGYSSYSAALWSTGWSVSFDNTALTFNGGGYGTPANHYNAIVTDTLPGADWNKISGPGKPEAYANYTHNTNQLTDGAGLGATANWSQVANNDGNRPENGATVGANSNNLKVGLGVNLLQNSDLLLGSTHWTSAWNQSGVQDISASRDHAGDDWRPTGLHNFGVSRAGTPTGAWDVANAAPIAVTPGTRYEASAYVACHRCVVDIALLFHDVNGNHVGEFHSTTLPSPVDGGRSVSGWARTWVFAYAPASANYVTFFMRSHSIGLGNPYSWVVKPFVGVAGNGQTEPSDWSPANFAEKITIANAPTYIADAAIDKAKILSLGVDQLDAGSLKVGSFIQSNAYGEYSGISQPVWKIDASGNAVFNNAVVRGTVYATAGEFSGTVSASTINSSQINGSTINAATINGSNINISGTPGGWGYIRSPDKWWFDGNDGWVLARNAASGDTLFEFKSGATSMRFGSGVSTGNHCSITFPNFSIDPSGHVTATSMNVALRNVLQTGSIGLGGSVSGGFINSNSEFQSHPAGTAIKLEVKRIIPTDIYDSYLLSTWKSQPFHCVCYPSGASNYSGGNGLFNVSFTGEVVVSRRYSPGGVNTTNDTRVYIYVESMVVTCDTEFNWFNVPPTLNWVLSRS